MTSNSGKPVKIFYCYAREDKVLRDQLEKHLATLKRSRQITTWYDREIPAGTEWKSEIDTHLETADIVLLLISADFMASDYCYDIEMQKALQRQKEGKCRVIPIILRPVHLKNTFISELQQLPADGKPITTWLNSDEAFKSTTNGIYEVIEEIQKAEAEPIQKAEAERARKAEEKVKEELSRREQEEKLEQANQQKKNDQPQTQMNIKVEDVEETISETKNRSTSEKNTLQRPKYRFTKNNLQPSNYVNPQPPKDSVRNNDPHFNNDNTESPDSLYDSTRLPKTPDIRRTRQLLRQNILATKARINEESGEEEYLQDAGYEYTEETPVDYRPNPTRSGRIIPARATRLPELLYGQEEDEEYAYEDIDPDLGYDVGYEDEIDPLDARLGYTEVGHKRVLPVSSPVHSPQPAARTLVRRIKTENTRYIFYLIEFSIMTVFVISMLLSVIFKWNWGVEFILALLLGSALTITIWLHKRIYTKNKL